jgi:hypothetical protein
VFSFCEDWHSDDCAHPLVRHYQTTLKSILESHPTLQRCLACCIHCGIQFLTHPRNAGRLNLRCPFGCREHHHRQRTNERGKAYYETASGRKKKKRLNARRGRSSSPAECEQQTDPTEQTTSPDEQLPDALSLPVELRLDGLPLDESSLVNSRMLPYVRMVTSLIQGIPIGLHEIVAALRNAMRQHRITYRSRIDYVLCFLKQHPP